MEDFNIQDANKKQKPHGTQGTALFKILYCRSRERRCSESKRVLILDFTWELDQQFYYKILESMTYVFWKF